MQQYSDEFKEQVLAEVDQVGNAALVARHYQISENPIYTWMAKRRKHGSVTSLPKAKMKRLKELEERLKRVTAENERLKPSSGREGVIAGHPAGAERGGKPSVTLRLPIVTLCALRSRSLPAR